MMYDGLWDAMYFLLLIGFSIGNLSTLGLEGAQRGHFLKEESQTDDDHCMGGAGCAWSCRARRPGGSTLNSGAKLKATAKMNQP